MSRPRLHLEKSSYREAKRPDGTLGFAPGGRGRGLLGAGWEFDQITSISRDIRQNSVVEHYQDTDSDDEEILLVGPASNVKNNGTQQKSEKHPIKTSTTSNLQTSESDIIKKTPSPHPEFPTKNKTEALETSSKKTSPTKPTTTQTIKLRSFDAMKTSPPQPEVSFITPRKTWNCDNKPKQSNSLKEIIDAETSKVDDDEQEVLLKVPLKVPLKEEKQSQGVTTEESKHFNFLLAKVSSETSQAMERPGTVDGSSLPVDAHKERIVACVEKHAVTVIRGDTGCGKSSRVPQFLIDANPDHRVVVAQPRRISAVALARRVAMERGQQCGASVGFRVGQSSKCGTNTVLTFVTVGYLLEKLVHHFSTSKQSSKKAPWEYTHIVVDEVHERDIETDLLCLVLRLLLKRHDEAVVGGYQGLAPFKVVCMSATFDANEFVRYFRPVTSSVGPPLAVGCLRHPMKEVYLDTLRKYLPYSQDQVSVERYLHSDMFKQPHASLEERSDVILPDYVFSIGAGVVLEVAKQRPGEGILVFVGGMADIDNFIDHLRSKAAVYSGDDAKLPFGIEILVLHSMVDLAQQAVTLDACRDGGGSQMTKTHVVVATNIAESSLTLPSLTTVIDFGVHKEVGYGQDGSSALRRVWVSRASARQRAGRAGRVAPGTVYRLYPKKFLDDIMRDWDAPEMTRMPLERVVLRAKLLGVSSVHRCLMDSLVPPPQPTVNTAINKLIGFGALRLKHEGSDSLSTPTLDEDLLEVTPLGELLSSLPLDIHLGKLVCLSAPLGCLPEAMVLALIVQGAARGDVFIPLSRPHSGGGGGNSSRSSPNEWNSDFVRALQVRQRWDRRLYSEPLATLEAMKQWLLFNLNLQISLNQHDEKNDEVKIKVKQSKKSILKIIDKEQNKWCEKHGVVKKKMAELVLQVTELSLKVSSLFPASSTRLALLFKPNSYNSTHDNDLDDFDTQRKQSLELFGSDIPMLRLLLFSVSLSSNPTCGILKATAKVTPPRALAKYPHSINTNVKSHSSSSSSEPISKHTPPLGARMALLSCVSFQPPHLIPDVKTASNFLKAKLEELVGPIKRIEFISNDETSRLNFTNNGDWLIEFPETKQAESYFRSNYSFSLDHSTTTMLIGPWSSCDEVEALADELSLGYPRSGFSMLHRLDIPLGLKLLVTLSKQRGGMVFQHDTDHRLEKEKHNNSTSKAKHQSSIIDVSVNAVRHSFHSQWVQVMDGTSVLPSKLSMLNTSSDTSKEGGYAACASSSGGGGAVISEILTLLPYDHASFTAAVLLLAPGDWLLGLGVSPQFAQGGKKADITPSTFQGGWLAPALPNSDQVRQATSSLKTLVRFNGVLTLEDIKAVNLVRSQISESVLKSRRSRLGCGDESLIQLIRNTHRMIANRLKDEVCSPELNQSKAESAEILFGSRLSSYHKESAETLDQVSYFPCWQITAPPTVGPAGCSLNISTVASSYSSPSMLELGDRNDDSGQLATPHNIPSAFEIEAALSTQTIEPVENQNPIFESTTMTMLFGGNDSGDQSKHTPAFTTTTSTASKISDSLESGEGAKNGAGNSYEKLNPRITSLASDGGGHCHDKQPDSSTSMVMTFETSTTTTINKSTSQQKPETSAALAMLFGDSTPSETTSNSDCNDKVKHGTQHSARPTPNSEIDPCLSDNDDYSKPASGASMNIIYRYSKEELMSLRPPISSINEWRGSQQQLDSLTEQSDSAKVGTETGGLIYHTSLANQSAPKNNKDTSATMAMLFGDSTPTPSSETTSTHDTEPQHARQQKPDTRATMAMLFGDSTPTPSDSSHIPFAEGEPATASERNPGTTAAMAMLFGSSG